MNSVTESLESYLKPEKLEGDNQYFCEAADKKLDAIKGFRCGEVGRGRERAHTQQAQGT